MMHGHYLHSVCRQHAHVVRYSCILFPPLVGRVMSSSQPIGCVVYRIYNFEDHSLLKNEPLQTGQGYPMHHSSKITKDP